MRNRADFEREAAMLIQERLAKHQDPAVRAIAALVAPSPEAIAAVADDLERKRAAAQ